MLHTALMLPYFVCLKHSGLLSKDQSNCAYWPVPSLPLKGLIRVGFYDTICVFYFKSIIALTKFFAKILVEQGTKNLRKRSENIEIF
jgi:hypothetical protein